MLLSKSIQKIIGSALKEDSAHRDITTRAAIPANQLMRAEIITKDTGVLCGLAISRAVFKQVDRKLVFKALKNDGAYFKKGQPIALIKGKARSILASERVALNFLSFLSGISTTTQEFVIKTKGAKVKIFDTRKTIPNLRQLQRYAVMTGGGCNHRSSLSSGVIIKDNHFRSGRYISKTKVNLEEIVRLIRHLRGNFSGKIEVEVETLAEFRTIAQAGSDIIMLDNFSLANLRKAVCLRNQYFPKLKLEASGGVTLKNIRAVACSGVDRISIGCLTHSLKAINFSLEAI